MSGAAGSQAVSDGKGGRPAESFLSARPSRSWSFLRTNRSDLGGIALPLCSEDARVRCLGGRGSSHCGWSRGGLPEAVAANLVVLRGVWQARGRAGTPSSRAGCGVRVRTPCRAAQRLPPLGRSGRKLRLFSLVPNLVTDRYQQQNVMNDLCATLGSELWLFL